MQKKTVGDTNEFCNRHSNLPITSGSGFHLPITSGSGCMIFMWRYLERDLEGSWTYLFVSGYQESGFLGLGIFSNI